MTGTRTSIGAPAQTSFIPAKDQSTVKHLRLTIKHVSKASPSVVHLYVQCGMVGFPIAIHAPTIPDIFVGTEWIAEYPAGSNPLDTEFTAIYPADQKPSPQKEKPMTDIIVASNGLSMTSLEIAALVESRHDSVKRTIDRLAEKRVIQLPPLEEVKNFQSLSPNSKTTAYIFTGEQGKRDSIIVVAQLSPEFTAKLVDRWQELEKQLAQPRPPAELTRMDILKIAMESEEARIKAEAERDEAVRTKAMISSKREATAMAKASAAVREANKLRHELGRNQHHATITAVEQVTGQKFPRNTYVALRRWCKAKGISPVDVVDERYGTVKAWPAGAWLDEYDIDLSLLFGHTEQPKDSAAERRVRC